MPHERLDQYPTLGEGEVVNVNAIAGERAPAELMVSFLSKKVAISASFVYLDSIMILSTSASMKLLLTS